MSTVQKIASASDITYSINVMQDIVGTDPRDGNLTLSHYNGKVTLIEHVRTTASPIFSLSKRWDRYDPLTTLAMWTDQIEVRQPDSVEALVTLMQDCVRMAEDHAVKLSRFIWIFKDNCYSVDGIYSDDQCRLLILDEYDKERKLFERLKQKHDVSEQGTTRARIRIPEQVRIEVWRRDGGKCTRCESRENLEYDHIIPHSRGGSNTARNIELLCEKCNRSKGATIG